MAHFDSLCQCPKVVAAVAAGVGAHPPPRLGGEGLQHGRRDGRADPLDGRLRALRVGAGLIPDRG